MPPYLLGYGLDTTSSRKTSLIPEPSTALPQTPYGSWCHLLPAASPTACSAEGSSPWLAYESWSVCHVGPVEQLMNG